MDIKRGLRPSHFLPNNESEKIDMQSVIDSLTQYTESLKKVRNCKTCGRFFRSVYFHRCDKCEKKEFDKILDSFEWELVIDHIGLIKYDK